MVIRVKAWMSRKPLFRIQRQLVTISGIFPMRMGNNLHGMIDSSPTGQHDCDRGLLEWAITKMNPATVYSLQHRFDSDGQIDLGLLVQPDYTGCT